MPGTLAQAVRAKYPDAYKDMSDIQLEEAVLKKYPQYAHEFPLVPGGEPQQNRAYNAVPTSVSGPMISMADPFGERVQSLPKDMQGRLALAGMQGAMEHRLSPQGLAESGAALGAGLLTEGIAGKLPQMGQAAARLLRSPETGEITVTPSQILDRVVPARADVAQRLAENETGEFMAKGYRPAAEHEAAAARRFNRTIAANEREANTRAAQMEKLREQDAAARERRGSETTGEEPSVTATGERYPGLPQSIVIPEPRAPLPGERPGAMFAVGRENLVPAAMGRQPGALEVLQSHGVRPIIIPAGADIESPRMATYEAPAPEPESEPEIELIDPDELSGAELLKHPGGSSESDASLEAGRAAKGGQKYRITNNRTGRSRPVSTTDARGYIHTNPNEYLEVFDPSVGRWTRH